MMLITASLRARGSWSIVCMFSKNNARSCDCLAVYVIPTDQSMVSTIILVSVVLMISKGRECFDELEMQFPTLGDDADTDVEEEEVA